MVRTEKASAAFERVRNIKVGLLKLSYAAATHGTTIETGTAKHSVPDYARQLAGETADLLTSVNSKSIEVDTLLKKKTPGGMFNQEKMYLENIRQGLQDVSNAVENGKVTITKNGSVYSILEYERKLLSEVDKIENGLRVDINKLKTELENKFMDHAPGGKASGPMFTVE
jgi:hypothetical protein